MKAATKGKRGKGRGKKQKKCKKGKGKKGNKNKFAKKSPSPSPMKSRKRQILSAGSSQPAHKKKTIRTSKKDAAAEVGDDQLAPGKSHEVPPAAPLGKAPKAAAKTRAKAKAKAFPKAKASPKDKASPKNKAAPKAKVKKDQEKKRPGRTPRKPGSELPASQLRDNEIVSNLMTFARKFPEDLETQPNKLKAAVLDEMTPLQYCKLMPYWSRNGCGVKVLQEDETTWADVHSFSFNSSSAPRRYKLAVAVRCAELTVARLNETLFSFFFWPIHIYIY